jgi:hypothetical protein
MRCPYCGQRGLIETDVLEHVEQVHAHSTMPVVCIVCCAQPWGDPSYFSQNFHDHLRNRHTRERGDGPPMMAKPDDSVLLEDFGPEWADGDTIGCGVRNGRIFFARNGKSLGACDIPMQFRGERLTVTAQAWPMWMSGGPWSLWCAWPVRVLACGSTLAIRGLHSILPWNALTTVCSVLYSHFLLMCCCVGADVRISRGGPTAAA